MELGILVGGWCPRGRRAEDGVIADVYPLRESPSSAYSQRTTWNVRDSDGTLIVTAFALSGGTAFTERVARRMQKPILIADLRKDPEPASVQQWIARAHIARLNVAGPRESPIRPIYQRARRFLFSVFGEDASVAIDPTPHTG